MPRLLWTQRQNIGPHARLAHAMAYDAARKQAVVFGGETDGGEFLGDTWAWDGEHWTQVADMGAGARAGHALAYDEIRERLVLFGGRNQGGLLGDTWEWNGENWTQVADNGPGARVDHALAFHATRRRVTLFGGARPDGILAGDTWEWDGEEWTEQEDTGPAPRRGHAMASDAARGRLVLFGGTDAGDRVLQDTWEWDGAAWTQQAAFGPEPAAGAAMVFKKSRIGLFGGVGAKVGAAAPPVFRFTWEWSGKHWTLRQHLGPGARTQHAMTFDTTRSRVVLFGGSEGPGGRALQDTWEHGDDTAAVPGPPAPPAPAASFDFSLQPVISDFAGPVGAIFVVPERNVPVTAQLSFTTAVHAAPAFLAAVQIPAGLSLFQASLPLAQIREVLGHDFVPPDDITITATIDGVTQQAVLRILP